MKNSAFRNLQRYGSLVVIGLTLNGCAIAGKTIHDVPQIKTENVRMPALSGLPERNLTLRVVDDRNQNKKDNSTEVRGEVERAVKTVLATQGVTVNDNSKSDLVIHILDHQTKDLNEGCVKMTMALTVPKKQARMNSESSGCFEMKSPLGGKLSADISKAYEESLSLGFQKLDQALAETPTLR